MREDDLRSEEFFGEGEPQDAVKPSPATPDGAFDTTRPGDTYQEGPYLVFTAQFHLRRGFCCNSGCRHCPYRAV